MGLLDIFKKKQQPLSFDIPPPPLDIPPPEAPAEFAGNLFNNEKPARSLPPSGDIEGKISASTSSLPPLPDIPSEFPPTFAEPDRQTHVDLLSDLPSDLPPLNDIPPPDAALPEFPEIPPELPADLSAELEEPPHPGDVHIPPELPSLSSGEFSWPSPLAGPAPLPERSFVFVPSSSFKDLLASIDDVKERARSSAKSDAFITLKNKEDSLLNQLQGSLESIQRKLLYIDTALFEKGEA